MRVVSVMNLRLPAWVGWPGGGAPPVHYWAFGPVLRFTTLLLAYGFVALALTVNYAASITFFLLSIIGMYVGLRRGFVNGLSRAEKLLMLAFATYPAVAVITYLVGTQTNIGFRLLGRDLRFLLFIPIYLAVRSARPRLEHVGWAFAGSALGALVIAVLQSRPWPALAPHGVAGTHITFGDLAMLSGWVAALAFWFETGEQESRKWKMLKAVAGLIAVIASIMAAVLSHARGSWPAVLVLVAVCVICIPRGKVPWRYGRVSILTALIIVLGVSGWLLPSVQNQIARAYRDFSAYFVASNAKSIDASCVDTPAFLNALLGFSHLGGTGTVKVISLESPERQEVRSFGCQGGYALKISTPSLSSGEFYVDLYRGNWPARVRLQSIALLARGVARVNVGRKGAWTRVENESRWKLYRVAKNYAPSRYVQTASIEVPPGRSVLVIPLQLQRGTFAFPLMKTSIGQRFQMWRLAWTLFLHHPWSGIGTGAFSARLIRHRDRGDRTASLGVYQHAHSDYLTSLSTEGLLGLLAFLWLLLAPVFGGVRVRHWRLLVPRILCVGIIALAFGIFGVTETMFFHSLVISWYTVVVAVLYASCFAAPGFKGKPID